MSDNINKTGKIYTDEQIFDLFINNLIQDIKDGKDSNAEYMFETLSQNACILMMQNRKKFFPFFENKFNELLKNSSSLKDDESFFDMIIILFKLSMMIHSFPLSGVMPFKCETTGQTFNHFQELSLIGLECIYAHLSAIMKRVVDSNQLDQGNASSGSSKNKKKSSSTSYLNMYQFFIGIEEQLSSIYLQRIYEPDLTKKSNVLNAKKYLERALEHAKALETMKGEVDPNKVQQLLLNLYQKLGLAYKKMGDMTSMNKAIECYERVLSVIEKNRPISELSNQECLSCGTIYNNLGNLCLQQVEFLLNSANSDDDDEGVDNEAPSQQSVDTDGTMIFEILNRGEGWSVSIAEELKKKKKRRIVDLLDKSISHFKKSLDLCIAQSDLAGAESLTEMLKNVNQQQQVNPSDLQQMSVIMMNMGYTQYRRLLFSSKSQVTSAQVSESLNYLNQSHVILEALMNPTDKAQITRRMSMMRVLRGQYARLVIFLAECLMIQYVVDKKLHSLELAAGYLEKARQHLKPEHGMWFARCTYDFASVTSLLPNQVTSEQEVKDLYQEAFDAIKDKVNPSKKDYKVLLRASAASQ